MTPNQITVLRIILSFASLALAQGHSLMKIFAVVLVIITISLDALDGYIARKRNMTTALGAMLDIVADRIVENVYLIYFASVGKIPFWIPVIFLVRGSITDFIRSLAMLEGKTAFGKTTMMQTRWGRQLVGSRWGRASYGVLKCITFCSLGASMSLHHFPVCSYFKLTPDVFGMLDYVSLVLVYLMVAVCVLRGLPVIWEGRKYLSRDVAVSTGS